MIVKNNTMSMHNLCDQIVLSPGPNMVPDELWDSLKDKGMTKVRLDLGDFEEVDSKMGVPALIKTIKQSTNFNDLRAWSSDSRAAVAKASDDRMREILKPKDPK